MTLDPSAALTAAINRLADTLERQNAGACPSVWEVKPFIEGAPSSHLVCRYLHGHTGAHRGDDDDARWTDGVDGAYTLGVDR